MAFFPPLLYHLYCREPTFAAALKYGNYFFTTIFAIESFIKIGAMSPRYFFAVSMLTLHSLKAT